MKVPKLGRKRLFLERGVPWLLFGLLAGGSAIALATLLDLGLLSDYQLFPAIVRGYTPTGVLFGVLSALAAGCTLFYSLRRRSLQESMPLGRGTLAMWLWAHVALGALALVFACVHAGYGAFSLQPSLGKALLLLLLFTGLSGVLWRVLYAFLPKRAARQVGNYAIDESLSRARAQAVEIDKLAAGRSPQLKQLVARVLSVRVDAAEAGRAAAGLSPQESAIFAEIARLASERHAALARAKGQSRFVTRLQGMRVWHVPVSLLFVVLLPLHVLSAYEAPERLAQLSSTTAPLAFEPSTTCARCHAQIVSEWKGSMHAHALDGPVMIAQTNVAARTTLSSLGAPDPKNLCVNCHAPLAARLFPSATLPLAQSDIADPELSREGVGCVACHAQSGESHTGGAALSSFGAALSPGRKFFGPRDDAVANAFHQSQRSPHFTSPERLCQNCHSVVYDRDGDGRIEKGKDLVLQDLFSEWEAYRASGGAHCVDCHMPSAGGTRSADKADVPFEQDQDAPARPRRSHRFVGPDYPLDLPALRDQTRAEREGLLQRAATLTLTSATLAGDAIHVKVSLQNTGAGHNLPGGFAFVRQMWLEVTVLDAGNSLLASSGRLASAEHDLCDQELLQTGRSLARFAVGCTAADPQLVNLQQRLLDRIEPSRDKAGNVLRDARNQAVLAAAAGADEVVVQHVTGGPVARVRPFDAKAMPPLAPGEARQFEYSFAQSSAARPARVRVRLLFRAVPPYFLRALASQQTPADGPRLDTFVRNIEVLEMAAASIAVAN
ncbi:MAG: multiheme c-type cytochrome [Polyangiaceae bacterium]